MTKEEHSLFYQSLASLLHHSQVVLLLDDLESLPAAQLPMFISNLVTQQKELSVLSNSEDRLFLHKIICASRSVALSRQQVDSRVSYLLFSSRLKKEEEKIKYVASLLRQFESPGLNDQEAEELQLLNVLISWPAHTKHVGEFRRESDDGLLGDSSILTFILYLFEVFIRVESFFYNFTDQEECGSKNQKQKTLVDCILFISIFTPIFPFLLSMFVLDFVDFNEQVG